MNVVGLISDSLCAAGFLALSGLLAVSWRGRLQGALLIAASLATALWAAVLALALVYPLSSWTVELVETLRDALWLIFLSRLLRGLNGSSGIRILQALAWIVPAVALASMFVVNGPQGAPLMTNGLHAIFVYGALCMALLGLILVEQLYINLRSDRRWAIKYLCIALIVLFAVDLFMYSQVAMFHLLRKDLWDARGTVDALAVPLIAVAAARNPNWSLDIFVSRRVALSTTVMMGVGIYLLLVSAGGYYIRDFSGTWGGFVEIVFVCTTLTLLLIVLLSGKARAYAKVFLNKHFFNYGYDYREEWLRLIRNLSDGPEQPEPYPRAIRAVAQILDSPGGGLWLRRDGSAYAPAARWNFNVSDDLIFKATDSLPQFLQRTRWIIDLRQYRERPDHYPDLSIPDTLFDLSGGRFVLPLFEAESLIGFMLLVEPHAPRQLTWEDRDFLKILGVQIGSYLALHEQARALSQARQFEAFNRMSAFLMHDLKNVIAQQSLVVRNAAKHKTNPAFVDDAIMTIDNSVRRMQRLLEQLQRQSQDRVTRRVAVDALLREVIARYSDRPPIPRLGTSRADALVTVDPEGFANVLGHLVRNAQDATPADGRVEISTDADADHVTIVIEDSGEGMDAAFVRDKLFQPFFSTKASKGMGIGAYQAREFVREAGGELQVFSTLGHGTRVQLRLPAAVGHAGPVAVPRAIPQP